MERFAIDQWLKWEIARLAQLAAGVESRKKVERFKYFCDFLRAGKKKTGTTANLPLAATGACTCVCLLVGCKLQLPSPAKSEGASLLWVWLANSACSID